MRLHENRIIAWIVLAVCIVFSIVILGGNSIARQREEVIDIFYSGADDRDPDHCMNAYLGRAFENARIMAQEVRLYLGDDHEDAAGVLELIDSFDPQDDSGFFEIGSRHYELRQIADDLYNDMYAANLSDEQRRDFKIAYDDFQGARKFMEKDPYYEMAVEFNRAREGSFISEVVCLIRGIDRLCEIYH